MRFIRPACALLVALFLAASALASLHDHSSQGRIYVQARRPFSPNHLSFNSSVSRKATRLAHRAAPSSDDPYHQRYYSESEGWTYYTLPALGAGRNDGK